MRIAVSVGVSCRREELFPWIADPRKAMRWQGGVKSGHILRQTPEKVGTTFTERIEEAGRSLVMNGEITGFIQDRLLSFHLDSKVHQVDVTYSIAEGVDGCTLTVESAIRWKFPMNLVSRIAGRKMREGIVRQVKAELTELKRLCELRD